MEPLLISSFRYWGRGLCWIIRACLLLVHISCPFPYSTTLIVMCSKEFKAKIDSDVFRAYNNFLNWCLVIIITCVVQRCARFGCFSPSRFSHFHCNAMRKTIKAQRICTQTSKTSPSLNKVSWDSNSSDMSSRQDVSRHSHNTRTAVEFLENSAKRTMLNCDHWEFKNLWTSVLWRSVGPLARKKISVCSWCSLFSSIYRIFCKIKRMFVSDGGQMSWWSGGMIFARMW